MGHWPKYDFHTLEEEESRDVTHMSPIELLKLYEAQKFWGRKHNRRFKIGPDKEGRTRIWRLKWQPPKQTSSPDT